jgi:hypothetical protein
MAGIVKSVRVQAAVSRRDPFNHLKQDHFSSLFHMVGKNNSRVEVASGGRDDLLIRHDQSEA